MTRAWRKDSLPIAITMGEPSGIGGELTLKAWQSTPQDAHPFFVLDAPERLSQLSNDLGLNTRISVISDPSECAEAFKSGLPVIALENAVNATPGQPAPNNAIAVIESIRRAFTFAKQGQVSAIVTNPIQKEILYRAQFDHPGHTEYLAHLDGADVVPVMMLASPMLRVVPITVHLSLQNAISMLSEEMIVEKTTITIDALIRDFNTPRPRVAIAGLNPHAGEQGTLGDEEARIIKPAIDKLRELGAAEIIGPVPPDALFTSRARESYDAAICMYHDQALIPIKALDFDRAVNVTLGLSVVRTSPDHGTALDIAAKGIADPTSLLAAIHMAEEIAELRWTYTAGTNG